MGRGVIGHRCMRGALTVGLAASLTAMPVTRVLAGTFTGGATEWTQVTNMIQLMQHSVSLFQSVIQLKKQCDYWYKNTKGMDSPMGVLQAAQGLSGLLGRMQGLLFASGAMLDRWQQTHPGRRSPEELGYDPREAYHRIEASTQSAVSRSLAVLDIQGNSADGWPTDRTIYASLADRMQTAGGQLQVSQVTNELLLEVIRQLHLMRQVQIAQAEMMGYHVSAESQRREYGDELLQRRLGYTGRYRATELDDFSKLGSSSR